MANVYPNLFSAFAQEAIATKNNMLSQGVVKIEVNQQVSRSGQYFSIPTQDNLLSILSDATAIEGPTTQITPTALSSYNENGLVAHIGEGIKEANLETLLKGDKGISRIYSQIAPYMMLQAQDFLISAINGVFATALSSSHTYDYSTTGDGKLSFDAMEIGSQAKLGEAFSELDAIIMHSKQLMDLKVAGAVDYVSAADFGANILYKGSIPVIGGKRVIVNDTLCAISSSKYPSYLVAGQPFYLGYQNQLRIETQRKADIGGGTDEAYFYMDFVPHVFGVSFSGTITNPTKTTYSTGSNWTKVGEDKNIKVVKLLTL